MFGIYVNIHQWKIIKLIVIIYNCVWIMSFNWFKTKNDRKRLIVILPKFSNTASLSVIVVCVITL